MRAGPALPCAGQRGTRADNPRRSALGAAKCEAERQPPPAKRRFRPRKDTGPTPPRLSDPQQLARGPAASRTRGDPSGDGQRLHAVGGQRRPPRSPPREQFPHLRPSRSSSLRGERTPRANTPPQAKRPRPAAPAATGPGRRGKLTAAATGVSARPAGFSRLGHRAGGDKADVSAPGSGGDCLGERSEHGAPARERTAPRDPQSVSRSATREGRASLRLPAPRREAGCALRGGNSKALVRAGGRLASGLGLRSATAAPPPLWLPKQSAPSDRAPGYKRRGAAGGEGREEEGGEGADAE